MFGMQAAISAPDPFTFVEDAAGNPGLHDTGGKTLYTGSLAGALVLLIAGQSNVASYHPTPYTPTNAGIYNLNVYDGAVYQAADPLLGCSAGAGLGGNFAGRLADKLINAGVASKVLLVPVGIGGSAAAQWTNTSNFGSRIDAALARLKARGLSPHAVLWGQGESDTQLGTTQTSYASSLSQLIASSRAAGYNGPWFIAKQTWWTGSTSSAVQSAQLAAVDHSAGIWAGPDADSLTTSYRQTGDDTHFTDAGSDAYAALWQTALHAYGSPF